MNERHLIITADDFGLCPSVNSAIMELSRAGAITSSMIMIPCPWAGQAAHEARTTPGINVGIHITLTSSSDGSRYGPVSREACVDSLMAEDGAFYPSAADVELNATEEAVSAEIRAQIEKAVQLGLDPTHLDSHEGSLLGLSSGRDFLEAAFELCEEYRLPFKLPRKIIDQPFLNPAQKQLFGTRLKSAQKRGIALIDDLIALPYHLEPGESYQTVKHSLTEAIKNIGAGITEIVFHPSADTDEIRSITPHWQKRIIEYKLFMDEDIGRLLQQEGIQLISWKNLRDLKRRDTET